MNISAVSFIFFLCQSALSLPAAAAVGAGPSQSVQPEDIYFQAIHAAANRRKRPVYDLNLDTPAICLIKNDIEGKCKGSFFSEVFRAAIKIVGNRIKKSPNSWKVSDLQFHGQDVLAVYVFLITCIDSSVTGQTFKDNPICRSDLQPIIDCIAFDRNFCGLNSKLDTSLGMASRDALTSYLRFIATNACEKRRLSEIASTLPSNFNSLLRDHAQEVAGLFGPDSCSVYQDALSSLYHSHEGQVVQKFLEGQSLVLALACEEQKQALVAECLIPALEQKNERSMMQRFYDNLRLFAENKKSLAQAAKQAELDCLCAEWGKGADNICEEADDVVLQLQVSPETRVFLPVDGRKGGFLARQYDPYFRAPGQQGFIE